MPTPLPPVHAHHKNYFVKMAVKNGWTHRHCLSDSCMLGVMICQSRPYLCFSRILTAHEGGVCCQAVCLGVVLPNCPNHPPSAPVVPHHPLHFAVEKAVGEADDEALRRHDDGLHGVRDCNQQRDTNASDSWPHHQCHNITYTQQWHHYYQCFCRFPMPLVMICRRHCALLSQLQNHDLQRKYYLWGQQSSLLKHFVSFFVLC